MMVTFVHAVFVPMTFVTKLAVHASAVTDPT